MIASGGGVVLNPKNIELLKSYGVCIYLKTNKSLIKQRMLEDGVPSFLDPKDVDGSFEKMYNEREQVYEDAHHEKLEIFNKSDSYVIEKLLLNSQLLREIVKI